MIIKPIHLQQHVHSENWRTLHMDKVKEHRKTSIKYIYSLKIEKCEPEPIFFLQQNRIYPRKLEIESNYYKEDKSALDLRIYNLQLRNVKVLNLSFDPSKFYSDTKKIITSFRSMINLQKFSLNSMILNSVGKNQTFFITDLIQNVGSRGKGLLLRPSNLVYLDILPPSYAQRVELKDKEFQQKYILELERAITIHNRIKTLKFCLNYFKNQNKSHLLSPKCPNLKNVCIQIYLNDEEILTTLENFLACHDNIESFDLYLKTDNKNDQISESMRKQLCNIFTHLNPNNLKEIKLKTQTSSILLDDDLEKMVSNLKLFKDLESLSIQGFQDGDKYPGLLISLCQVIKENSLPIKVLKIKNIINTQISPLNSHFELASTIQDLSCTLMPISPQIIDSISKSIAQFPKNQLKKFKLKVGNELVSLDSNFERLMKALENQLESLERVVFDFEETTKFGRDGFEHILNGFKSKSFQPKSLKLNFTKLKWFSNDDAKNLGQILKEKQVLNKLEFYCKKTRVMKDGGCELVKGMNFGIDEEQENIQSIQESKNLGKWGIEIHLSGVGKYLILRIGEWIRQ